MHHTALGPTREGCEECDSQWVVNDVQPCHYAHRVSLGRVLSDWEKGGAISVTRVSRRPSRDSNYGAGFLGDVLHGREA